MLVRQREQISAGDQINLDLTYSVSFDYMLYAVSICKSWTNSLPLKKQNSFDSEEGSEWL